MDIDLVDMNQSALVTPTPEPTTDTLQAYAAKCDVATGIRVPDFSCNTGLSGAADPNGANEANFAVVSQVSSLDNVERDTDVGGATATRTVNPSDPTKQQIVATGSGIGGFSDSFRFSSVDWDGYKKAEVKITSLTNSTAGAMAGLMFRDNLDYAAADAINTVFAVRPAANCTPPACAQLVLQHRDAKGGDTTPEVSTTQLGGVAVKLPIWLRLTFNGDGVIAQASFDHNTWTQVGPTLESIDRYRQAGLAVSATTASFENFMTTMKCDKPTVLRNSCEPESTFQVLARTADAIAVANCRKGVESSAGVYNDIAVIQYNRKNGALCFYQSPTNDALDGSNISAPSKGNEGSGIFPWQEPAETHAGGCTGCHDSGGLIRSPYLKQTGLLPKFYEGYNNDGMNPLRYVGIDFEGDRSWTVNHETGPCSSCHTMATNNFAQNGTAHNFAIMANSRYQTYPAEMPDANKNSRKNDVSVNSPTWMPGDWDSGPSGLTSWPDPNPYLADAKTYNACSKAAWFEPEDNENEHRESGFLDVPVVPGCEFRTHGQPFGRWLWNLNEYNIGNRDGSATGNSETVTLTASDHTDVYEGADNFYWLYQNQGGDGSAVVRVKRLDATNGYAKAGIMFRNGYSPGAVNVMVALTADHGPTFQYRSVQGDPTQTAYLNADVDIDPELSSVWLRLDRTGRTFVGFISTDNRATWTQVAAPVTLVGLETDFLGLVATSNLASEDDAEAEFESFDWGDRTGWTRPFDSHVLMDANIGTNIANSSTKRKEWITRETISVKSGDITGTADNFSYSFKTFGGPGHLETTVASLGPAVTGQTVDTWAKAGLMVRENASAGSPYVFVGKTRDGITFQYRPTANAATTATNYNVPNVPISFRLRRDLVNGQHVFTAAYSTGGGTWTAIAQQASFSSFISSPLSGLAVSANSGSEVRAVFESGELVEPPGMLWTSYDQAENNNWREADVATAVASLKNEVALKTIVAAGADIAGSSDQFGYAFQDIPGPATIIAKVTLKVDSSTDPLAKAGLMFRSKAAAGSRNVMLALTKGFGATLQVRGTDGSNTTTSNYAGSGNSMWLKLVRTQNNQFNGYTSADGVTWTLLSSTTLSTIGDMPMVGLAVTSHDVNNPLTATFSNVSITRQPVLGPCAAYCASPSVFTFGTNYQSGNLGTAAVCRETTRPVTGGNCGNFAAGRTFSINGVTKTCNGQNWSSVPAAVNGGYCLQANAGNHSYAFFTLFN